MLYTVIVMREADGRYTAFAPALNDCASFGQTLPEALQEVEEAISLYVETLRARDWPVPEDNPQVVVDMSQTSEVFVYRLPVRDRRPHREEAVA